MAFFTKGKYLQVNGYPEQAKSTDGPLLCPTCYEKEKGPEAFAPEPEETDRSAPPPVKPQPESLRSPQGTRKKRSLR